MRTPVRKRDDEGYRKDGSNPVDDAIMKRNVARRKAAVRKVQADDNKNKQNTKDAPVTQVKEGGMAGRTKPSRELNIQNTEKPHLAGDKSLKFQKRAAHKAERKKGKQDVQINPDMDETVDRAKRGVDIAKSRVLAAKHRLARTKARDIGKKRQEMRTEDAEQTDEGQIAPRPKSNRPRVVTKAKAFTQAGRSADYKARIAGTQQRYAANRVKRSANAARKHGDTVNKSIVSKGRAALRRGKR